MSNLSTKKSPNPKSAAAPKKTSATSNQAPRRKTPSIAVAAEAPPQLHKLKAERVAAPDRKTQPKTVQTSTEATEAHDPKRKSATKPERALTLLSQPEAEKPKASDNPVATAVERPKAAEAQHEERATKQDRMLTLLSRPGGASIEEMMRTTNWQQHSVRGFLAGTLKKKLGFSLTSSKPGDGARRYRIEPRRGR